MPTPHKHAALIKAWADGAQIQHFSYVFGTWYDVMDPYWSVNEKYRIKPQEPDFGRIAELAWVGNKPWDKAFEDCAKAVIEAYKQWAKDNKPENDGG